MNTALLVLRLMPGLLFIGHGLQKLLPARYSPALLRASGHRATADAFDGLGIHPSVLAAVLVGSSEVVGGFAFAAGLLTPIGTILIGAVMTTAILTVHLRQGIWNQDGGFEFPFVLLTLSFVISAVGPGSYSVNAWAHVNNWAGADSSLSNVALAGIALGVGVAAGLLTSIVSRSARRAATGASAEAAVS